MKCYLIIILLFMPTALYAQNYGNMNQGNMQNMMQVMQQVQQCMAQIDQNELNKLQARSEKFKSELDSLCSQGKRDKAQKKAFAFGREIASNKTMKQMRKCGEMAQGAMPMDNMVKSYSEKDYKNRHVCDE